jgi:hypothetical protein
MLCYVILMYALRSEIVVAVLGAVAAAVVVVVALETSLNFRNAFEHTLYCNWSTPVLENKDNKLFHPKNTFNDDDGELAAYLFSDLIL